MMIWRISTDPCAYIFIKIYIGRFALLLLMEITAKKRKGDLYEYMSMV